MKVGKYFVVQSFVPKSYYDYFGEHAIRFVDPWLIFACQFIREYFNKPMILNNYHLGGKLQNRALRAPFSKVGGKLSFHKFSEAGDFNIVGMDDFKVYKTMLKDPVFYDAGIRRLERIEFTPGWIHFDRKETDKKKIITFIP